MYAEKAGLILTQVAIQTLEDAAFLYAQPLQGEPQWSDELFEAQLDFRGEAEGRLRLTTERSFADRLAADLLGFDPGEDPDVDARGNDALGEILNIITGMALSAWFGPRCICEIGAPRVTSITATDQVQRAGDATCAAVVITDGDDPVAVSAAIAGGSSALRRLA